jgi:hypothetical protein
VALLFALGLLAERAGAKPRPLRAALLWLLRAAETIARDFVLEQFQEKWEPVELFRDSRKSGKAPAMVEDFGGRSGLPASPPAHDAADDAMRLAQSFRALAELLTDLVGRSTALVPPARARRPFRDLPRGLRNLADMLTPAKVAPEPPDTS